MQIYTKQVLVQKIRVCTIAANHIAACRKVVGVISQQFFVQKPRVVRQNKFVLKEPIKRSPETLVA
jgi:ABC-type ATPase involved in cell division